MLAISRRTLPLAVLALCGLLTASNRLRAAEQNAAAASIGKQLDNFELRDFRGKSHSLDDFKDKRLVVIAVLGIECPLALQYAPRLVELSKRFAPSGVAFVGINSNQQDSITELAHYARVHDIHFPLLKDVGNKVADQLAAERTPEVFVLDADRKVRYRGRIDDQYVVGRQRKEPTRDDLAIAIRELLDGGEVSQPVTEAQGCRIGRIHKPEAHATVTYTKDIAPLLNRRCVECHRKGEIAPFALTDYAETVGWAEMMLEVVEDNRMPPWHADPKYGHFSNDRRMTDEEKQLLADWVKAGAPQGNPKDMPDAPEFAEGWRLPRVDKVVYMADEPFHVPAEGVVEYKHFVVDPGFTHDVWVQGAEVRAGNRAVVHHVILAARDPNRRGRGRNRKDAGDGLPESYFLTATAPGAHPMLLPDGQAKLVKAGSKLVFQVHYTPNGSPQKDRSSVGLMFTSADQVRKEVRTMSVDTHLMMIPPRAPNYELDAWHTFTHDTLLLSMFPHMHLRGKSFRFEAQYPDGSKEILLDVPRYDFAWQQTYELATPKLLPKGTKMRCLAHYDNSTDNIANPNPDALVHWGEQTWDEMLMGFLNVTTPDEAEIAKRDDASAGE